MAASSYAHQNEFHQSAIVTRSSNPPYWTIWACPLVQLTRAQQ